MRRERTCPRPEDAAADFIIPENGVETVADALQGANDIVAELLSDDAAIRKTLRGLLMRQGHLRSLAAKEEDSVYRLYYDFDQSVAKLADHQILAINRGEKEGLPVRHGAARPRRGAPGAAPRRRESPAPPRWSS